jgi:hypothetical protein
MIVRTCDDVPHRHQPKTVTMTPVAVTVTPADYETNVKPTGGYEMGFE